MQDTSFEIDIATPEQVQLKFQLAGIGTRAIANLLDSLLLLAFYVSLWGTFYAVARYALVWHGTDIIGAILILLSFLSFWGYFIIFEYFLSGQTPGKRWKRIRVIRFNGTPITFWTSAIRNLLRLLDLLPMFYCVGLVAMLIDKSERRIGDIAAGTMVIHDVPLYQLGLFTDDVANNGRESAASVGSKGMVAGNSAEAISIMLPKHALQLVVCPPLPAEWDHAVRQFAKRRKRMSRGASGAIAQKLWSNLLELPTVRLESTVQSIQASSQQVAEHQTVTYEVQPKTIVATIAELSKVMKRRLKNKG